MSDGDPGRRKGGASRRATPARRRHHESPEVAESRGADGPPEPGESKYAPPTSARPGVHDDETAGQPLAGKQKPSDHEPNPENAAGPEAVSGSTTATPTHAGTIHLTLTDPDTAPMTPEQHSQAVSALSAMIVSWLQRNPPNPPPDL